MILQQMVNKCLKSLRTACEITV